MNTEPAEDALSALREILQTNDGSPLPPWVDELARHHPDTGVVATTSTSASPCWRRPIASSPWRPGARSPGAGRRLGADHRPGGGRGHRLASRVEMSPDTSQEHPAGQAGPGTSRDGLAAVAVLLVTIALIALVVARLI